MIGDRPTAGRRAQSASGGWVPAAGGSGGEQGGIGDLGSNKLNETKIWGAAGLEHTAPLPKNIWLLATISQWSIFKTGIGCIIVGESNIYKVCEIIS